MSRSYLPVSPNNGNHASAYACVLDENNPTFWFGWWRPMGASRTRLPLVDRLSAQQHCGLQIMLGFDRGVTTNPAHVHPSRKEEQISHTHGSEAITTGLAMYFDLPLLLLFVASPRQAIAAKSSANMSAARTTITVLLLLLSTVELVLIN